MGAYKYEMGVKATHYLRGRSIGGCGGGGHVAECSGGNHHTRVVLCPCRCRCPCACCCPTEQRLHFGRVGDHCGGEGGGDGVGGVDGVDHRHARGRSSGRLVTTKSSKPVKEE